MISLDIAWQGKARRFGILSRRGRRSLRVVSSGFVRVGQRHSSGMTPGMATPP